MDWFAISGYMAAGLVFTTFCMKTMMPLRMVAIASNAAFIAYGILGDLYPIFALHAILMPLNLYRLYQVRRMVRQVAEASRGDLSLGWLVPLMSKKRFAKDEILFRRGDSANEVFVILEGLVKVRELDTTVGPGELIGEIGVFSPDRQRTQTVSCETDIEVLSMTDEKMYELYFQNPKLGFYLMRLIIGRLLESMRQPSVATASTPTGPPLQSPEPSNSSSMLGG